MHIRNHDIMDIYRRRGSSRKRWSDQSKKRKQPLEIPIFIREYIEEILTVHAWKRMAQRAISRENIAAVMMFGSLYSTPRAEIIVLGRRESRRAKFDLQRHRGIHIVLKQGMIVTTYRNNTVQLRYRR